MTKAKRVLTSARSFHPLSPVLQRFFRKFVCSAMMVALLSTTTVTIATNSASEEEITAAFLFNFARYTLWPTGDDVGEAVPLRFCFVRADRVARVFGQVLGGSTIDGRAVLVNTVTSASEMGPCELVYTDDPAPAWLRRPAHGCLTIGRGDKFISNGGIIAVVRVDDHLRFKVNRENARRAGLVLSSKLLRLAIEVIDE